MPSVAPKYKQGTKTTKYRAPEYNVQPLLTDQTGQQSWYRMLRSCFLSSFVEFRSVVAEEKSTMSEPIRG